MGFSFPDVWFIGGGIPVSVAVNEEFLLSS